jgi:hypothetical protein
MTEIPKNPLEFGDWILFGAWDLVIGIYGLTASRSSYAPSVRIEEPFASDTLRAIEGK